MTYRFRIAATLIGISVMALTVAGCTSGLPEPGPPQSETPPTVVTSMSGDWTSQSVGGATLITTTLLPEYGGLVPVEGELVLTDEGCFATERDGQTLPIVFSDAARMLPSGKFEIDEKTFAVGDMVLVTGTVIDNPDVPALCGKPARAKIVTEMSPLAP